MYTFTKLHDRHIPSHKVILRHIWLKTDLNCKPEISNKVVTVTSKEG